MTMAPLSPTGCGETSKQKHVWRSCCRRQALSHLSVTDLALVISWTKFYTCGSPGTSTMSTERCMAGHVLVGWLCTGSFLCTARLREAGEQQQLWQECASSWRKDRPHIPTLPRRHSPRSASRWCLLHVSEVIHCCWGCLVYTVPLLCNRQEKRASYPKNDLSDSWRGNFSQNSLSSRLVGSAGAPLGPCPRGDAHP